LRSTRIPKQLPAEYIAHRDFTPIQTVDDDALLRLARAPSQAAELTSSFRTRD
jgi:hypothetical protein